MFVFNEQLLELRIMEQLENSASCISFLTHTKFDTDLLTKYKVFVF